VTVPEFGVFTYREVIWRLSWYAAGVGGQTVGHFLDNASRCSYDPHIETESHNHTGS